MYLKSPNPIQEHKFMYKPFWLLVSLIISALILYACNDDSASERRYFLTPEVTNSDALVDDIDVASGALLKNRSDLSMNTLLFSRSLVAHGVRDAPLGGWRHNYSSTLDSGIAYEQWHGIKSDRYQHARDACISGWDNIKSRAYNGQLRTATAIFNDGLCDLYLDSEIVASLPVRSTDYDPSFPLHTLVKSDGSTLTFFKKNSKWISTTRSQYQLYPSNGQWVVETPDNTLQTFNAAGRLAHIQSPTGQTITLEYHHGLLSKVIGSFGQSLTLFYTEGKLSKVDSAAGNARYHYNHKGELARVTGVDGGQTSYQYNAGRLSSVTDSSGIVVARYQYDEVGRVVSRAAVNHTRIKDLEYTTDGVSVTDRASARADHYTFQVRRGAMQLTNLTNADGKTETREYDANGYPAKVTATNGTITTTTYNRRGLLVARITHAGTDSARTTLTVWHPKFNAPIKQAEPGRVTFFDYNDKGLLTRRVEGTVDPASRRLAIRSPQQLARLKRSALKQASVRETTFTYTENGQLQSTTDANGMTTKYEYDDQGNRTTSVDAQGNVEKVLEFDAAGRALKTQNTHGQITEAVYDTNGRLVSTTQDGQTTRYEYDAAGRQTRTIDPDGNTISNEYDAAGNLIKFIDQDGNVMTSTFDANGNQLSDKVVDANGNVLMHTTSEYNAKNQLIRRTDGAGHTTAYAYDSNGNRTQVTDEKGRITKYEYDNRGRLLKSINGLTGEILEEYDVNGNPINDVVTK
ncbi:MAG: hypothetical protein CR991_00790 [Proteobacteria bacterium]|nr:MAG: hypothetical protein CR991_00790 [Pseudomonadota bacterium]